MADASQQINGLGYLTPSSAAKAVSSADAAVSTNPPASNDGSTIGVQVEFGGGLDLLFSRQPRHNLRIPASYPSSSSTISSNSPSSPPTMRHLIEYLAKNVLREREELFREGETVRPGILVLVNDIDWELEGELACVLEDGDEVVFISTLHGG